MEQTHDSPTALELYKGHPVQEAAQIILGSLLFSASMNWIILPHDMYSGGFLGIAQLLRMLLLHFFPAIQQIGDLAGILYFLLNIPLLLISWFRFGHFFFAKTALCIVCYSAFLALIPIPAEGLFDETIAACVIGGLVCGVGAGMTLTAGCSGGGEEILGLLCVQKKPDFSVGRIAMILNVFVYGIGLLLFEQDVVVYSIIFGCTTYLTLDRMHLQNVMVTMLIITKSEAMEQLVFRYAGRGVTKWTGVGAYSNEPSDFLLTVVSKKEALHLRKILREEDPNSFIIMDEDVSVAGNFQKRL